MADSAFVQVIMHASEVGKSRIKITGLDGVTSYFGPTDRLHESLYNDQQVDFFSPEIPVTVTQYRHLLDNINSFYDSDPDRNLATTRDWALDRLAQSGITIIWPAFGGAKLNSSVVFNPISQLFHRRVL